MVEVIFNFNELRCIQQYDRGGASEPYMWFDFFYVDSSTLTSGSDLVATRNMQAGVSGRNLFEGNVRPGKIIAIPASLGRIRVLLDDMRLQTPAIGVVYALLEKNDTSDRLMQTGHRVFGQAFHEEINTYVRNNLPNVPSLSQEEKDAMAERIKDRVFDAVRADADFLEYFRTKDRVIGFGSEYFPWNVLTLLRDRSPGQPYQIPQTIRLEQMVMEYGNIQPVKVVDEYEVRGSIQVSPYTRPAPDPCQAQKNAYNEAAQLVDELQRTIEQLREQWAAASALEKPDIAADIAEAQASLNQALDRAQAAQAAYTQCRNQNSTQKNVFTF